MKAVALCVQSLQDLHSREKAFAQVFSPGNRTLSANEGTNNTRIVCFKTDSFSLLAKTHA